MNSWAVILDIALLLGAALLLGMVFERLRQNAVLGYVLAGILLGPTGTGWISAVEDIRVIAELGVALLLFTIGLEFSWNRLRESGPVALFGGIIQILLTAVLAGLGSTVFGLPPVEATIVGAALSLSSTAVVLRVLADRAELESLPGRNALGILLLQDLAVVPMVLFIAALGERDSGSDFFGSFAFSVGLAGVVIGVMFLVSKYIFPRLIHGASTYRNRDLPVLLAFAFCLGAATISHAANLSPILGAFVAGMLLAESPFSAQMRADLIPLRAVFLTLFFASVGMMADPPLDRHLMFIVPVALAIMLGKAVIVGFVVRLFGQPHGIAIATGLALAQIGEFSFVLLELGYRQGLVSFETFQTLLSASLLTLVVTPYAIAAAPRLRRFVNDLSDRFPFVSSEHAQTGLRGESTSDRVIIVGFGPAGQRVARALETSAVAFVVVDLNPRAVTAHESAFPITFGDAARSEILLNLGIEDARAVVVTVPEPQTSEVIIRQSKRIAPHVPVIVRARYHVHAPTLVQAGADSLVDEEGLIGEQLAVEVMQVVHAGKPHEV